ncbi:hypothetical protein C8R45DRAFT_838236 [Mycena sanguinolenta]|nr:hypothetical protein C8R45DRAFT_838236 [Mycena sanguinolenta]
MTDYGLQGKSRDPNVVHLNNCRNHRAYHVALSRGTKAATVILQGFDEHKITQGMSGYLRQELCELKILDEITRLKFESKLPPHVNGIYRQNLIHQYKTWKGHNWKIDPPQFHRALRFNSELDLDEDIVDYLLV